MKPEQVDAYIAGIFDGEGSFVVDRDTQGYIRVRCNISQEYCDQLLEWLIEQLGFGWTVEGPKCWVCTRANVVKLLDRIQPYLIVKKQEATLIRAICEADGRSDKGLLLKEALVELWKKTRIERRETRAQARKL